MLSNVCTHNYVMHNKGIWEVTFVPYFMNVCVCSYQTPVGLSYCPDGSLAHACSDSVSRKSKTAQNRSAIVRSSC